MEMVESMIAREKIFMIIDQGKIKNLMPHEVEKKAFFNCPVTEGE